MSDPIDPVRPPAEITHLVRERSEARTAHDWPRADELKARIEAAGWTLIDSGRRTTVRPAVPADLEVAGERRYGSPASVPSRLDEPAGATASVVVVASEEPGRVSGLLAALRATAPPGTHVVVVANDPSAAQEAALAPAGTDRASIAGREIELVRTSARLGFAAALQAGIRRAAGRIVLLADGSAIPQGDAFSPVVDVLEDPDVAVAGAFGLVSTDPDTVSPATLVPGESRDVVALEAAWLAFRRDDYASLGPLDERFVTPAWLDVWWSLRLRAGPDPEWPEEPPEEPAPGVAPEGVAPASVAPEATERDDEEAADVPPNAATARPGREAATPPSDTDTPLEIALPPVRRAVRLDLPLVRDAADWPPARTRLNRRNMYRVLDVLLARPELLAPAGPETD